MTAVVAVAAAAVIVVAVPAAAWRAESFGGFSGVAVAAMLAP